jgi:hypothetical protein
MTLAVFALVGAVVFLAGWALDRQSVALPGRITAASPCPVAGCTQPDGSCHADSAYPAPDGSFEMYCPRVEGCADTDCHAWGRIGDTRAKPSDASMNLWILAPVVLVLVLVGVARKL